MISSLSFMVLVICVFSHLLLFNLAWSVPILLVFRQMTFNFIDFLLFFCSNVRLSLQYL